MGASAKTWRKRKKMQWNKVTLILWRQAFIELKREVSKKAVFSRTEKPIPERTIDEWEENEGRRNK